MKSSNINLLTLSSDQLVGNKLKINMLRHTRRHTSPSSSMSGSWTTMEADTLSLRKAAPQWSLAGDKQLLGMLEKIHQTIVTKCQDTNAQLEAMVDALDNASVDLQNVNNKFMALSNSQFVESRVYDDDVDVAVENIQKQEPPKVPTTENNTEKIKLALQKLELMHEPVHILDSDSSDDEEETRMVLKPKDMYSHRPLPYIIGSFAWKSKWHAGLLPEESDSDSSASRDGGEEQYSASEPEPEPDAPQQQTISSSSSSSSLLSEEPSVVKQKPADIAAEISRRLAGPPVKVPTSPLEAVVGEQPAPAAGKVYRMDVPTTATIFPDEPPPIDNVESDYSDDDIFAELHKKPHQNKPSQYKADIMDDLFGNNISDDVGNVEGYMKSTTVRDKSPIFDDISESRPITEIPTHKPISDTESNLKKPVGGISLFGTNKGAESIGAAILKRNQRKSSSEEETDVTDNKHIEKAQGEKPKEPLSDSKKIIEDLFAKPVKKNEKDFKSKKPVVNQVINKEPALVQSVKTTDKIDLFSDNLFDDIDDIFTTNVISKPKVDKNTKSIFDDDDLFSEITEKSEKPIKKDTKSIFDSDDDLFTENDKVATKASSKPATATTSSHKISEEANKKVKNIFDDDSDDGLFSDVKVTKSINTKSLSSKIQSDNTNTKTNKNDEEIVHNKENRLETDKDVLSFNIPETKQFQSASLFDDEDDELFNTTKNIDQNINRPESSSKVFDTDDSYKTANKAKDDAKSQSNNNLESKEASNVTQMKTSDTFENKQQISVKEISKENTTDYDSNIQDNEVVQVNEANDENMSTPEQNKEKEECNDIFKDNILKDEPNLNRLTNVSNTQQQSQDLLSESKEPDLFTDIFADLPPAFEKPSEPKKSKNVNALFDDDSDDETLFFKKDDVISDEKPEINFDNDRFTIFHDEPPDIDVDFSQKPLKTSHDMLKDNIFNEDNFKDEDDDKPMEYVLPQDLDDTITKSDSNTEAVHSSNTKEEIKKENIDILKLLEDEKADGDSDKLKHNIFQDDIKIERKETQSNEDNLDSSGEYETKKPIGKLKPMNFNINVSTLLPGASPKKSKANEEIDGQSVSTKSNEELNIHSPSRDSKSESLDSKMVKSVSFDGDPDSEVLDNKLSKERAKIQVKRRPSTRRARLEAVRKSRIDLGSDSTDNSGSFDESMPRKNDMDEIDSSLETYKSKNRSEENSVSMHTEFRNVDNKNTTVNKNLDTKTEVKSKIVYILNDEDIFSNTANKQVTDDEPNKKVLNIVDDDDEDLFKPTKSSSQKEKDRNLAVIGASSLKDTGTESTKEQFNSDKSLFSNPTDKEVINDKPNKKILNIDDDDDENLFKATNNNSQKNKEKDLKRIEANNTLSLKDTENVTKKDVIQHKKSLFDDSDDDEELFKNNKIDKVKKAKIFDSDSENELFANQKKIEKKEIRKGPLFDDESDDDLFGTKTAKVFDTKTQPSKPKETKSKSTEPVFEDPLSMLEDDS
ncbi:unnamed protein product, partial [Brenthis ino]